MILYINKNKKEMNNFEVLPLEVIKYIMEKMDRLTLTLFIFACKQFQENRPKEKRLTSKKEICESLADGGHLEGLKWARENGCPWDVYTCARAARNGHLETLKWAQDNGCPWDEWTCMHLYMSIHPRGSCYDCPWMNGHV
jgi:hypothetical protein